MNWLRNAATGATPLLESAVVAVIFAPVLPDIAVDLFGGGAVPNWLLRVFAIIALVAGCFGLYRRRLGRARRRARDRGYRLADLEQRDVLVIPLGLNNNYQRRSDRTGRVPLACWLIDTIQPKIVIGVTNPGVTAAEVDRTRRELDADGVVFDDIRLPSGVDATVAVPAAQTQLRARLAQPDVTGKRCYIDVTGGNVVLSIAMLQVAAALGNDCVYVASDFDEKRNLIEGSQTGKSFDPRRFGGA
ncbi:MAG: hypothetical protein L0H64_22430, partial [Pseudonocardia sp.]|nr:hypothetical protein [Pseudonocardia sp.]